MRSYYNLPNLAQPLKHLDTYHCLKTQLTELIGYNRQLWQLTQLRTKKNLGTYHMYVCYSFIYTL